MFALYAAAAHTVNRLWFSKLDYFLKTIPRETHRFSFAVDEMHVSVWRSARALFFTPHFSLFEMQQA
jgi:hypothetical protein